MKSEKDKVKQQSQAPGANDQADLSSGYTDDIDGEMEAGSPQPVESAFANIRQCYVSPSGHTRLLTATRYGKLYMLKCLKADFCYTPIYRQALAKEFEIGLLLDHPNICRTIGMEQVDGLGQTIVMEYIDGDTLQSLIDSHALTKQLARKVAQQLASALDYMHSRQAIHRDLKPSNIMVTHNGQNVKLIDFSLADSDSFSVLKLPAGTSGYIAPELLVPGASANGRADAYSLGMVMRDMAEATGDKRLMHLAEACTRRRPADRPEPLSRLFAAKPAPWWQRIALAAMICAAAALATYVALTLHRRAQAEPPAQSGSPGAEANDDNEALDYNLWPRP